MAVVKLAANVVTGDLVDGALFNANGDLLEVTDGDIATYVCRLDGSQPSLEAVDRTSLPLNTREFAVYRSDVNDVAVPSVAEVQAAGYSITAFGPYDNVIVTLGLSRRYSFIYKPDETGFYDPKINRIDGYSIDASLVDGTAVNSLPDHNLFRVGDVVLLLNTTDQEEVNHYQKVSDVGNGDAGWKSVYDPPEAISLGTAVTLPISITTGLDWAGDLRTTNGGAALTIDPSSRGYDRVIMDQALTLTAGTFLEGRPFSVQIENPTAGSLSLTLSGFTFYGTAITDIAAGEFATLQGRCVVVNGSNVFAVYSMSFGGAM